MPPEPKHPSVRARRNKTSTAAKLSRPDVPDVPELPEAICHPQTLAWWADVWASPMAPEYDESDRHGLFALAQLVDDFWMADTAKERAALAGEIRLQRQCFGLTPIDRRRLQWEIERTDEAVDRGSKRRAKAAPAASSRKGAEDPRAFLRAV